MASSVREAVRQPTATSATLNLVGVNYRTAPLELRERLAFTEGSLPAALQTVIEVASEAYITEVLLLLWPRPRTWPSSCITAVSKSYWPAPTCVGLAPAYQFQPWIIVTWSASVVHPSTP